MRERETRSFHEKKLQSEGRLRPCFVPGKTNGSKAFGIQRCSASRKDWSAGERCGPGTRGFSQAPDFAMSQRVQHQYFTRSACAGPCSGVVSHPRMWFCGKEQGAHKERCLTLLEPHMKRRVFVLVGTGQHGKVQRSLTPPKKRW